MGLVAGVVAGVWVFYSYHKYAETRQAFYPITGFIIADLYGALMMAGPTAEFVMATL